VDNVGLLNPLADLFTATGARGALGRVPRGRGGQPQSVKLLEAVTDLPVGKAVIVPRQRRLCDDVHPELPL